MDDKERLEVLSPHDSFIVEAPAGSGKTELLTLRYLSLLACVQRDPEEVVAVTFTRKAASEMKHRVLSALKQANELDAHRLSETRTSLQEKRLKLAQLVLAKDRENKWFLLENPNRLRILTLDSLSMMLAYRTPILSHFGGKPDVHDFPKTLYQSAVKNFIRETTNNEPWYEAFQTLFLYFENIEKIADWMTQLLSCRDQWLPYIFRLKACPDFNQWIKRSINIIQENAIAEVIRAINAYENDIFELVDYIAGQFECMGKSHIFQSHLQNQDLPSQADSISFWLALVDLFLTQPGDWRKMVNKNHGFLAPSDAPNSEEKKRRKYFKDQHQSLIGGLSQSSDLNMLLHQLRNLPSDDLIEEEYHILISLQVLLPVLVGCLNLVFKETGKVDFVEISLGALYALRDEQGPTQTAQILDYKISHILVDEFQDTSAVQFELLENLIAEWQPNDGKTVFLVGDPQQSIYRFRGAEVGVFLHAQTNGIANISLKNIHLKRNFRTQPEVLDWISQTICHVFPPKNDLTTGAVAYKQSFSACQTEEDGGVFLKYFDTARSQTHFMIEKILDLQKQDPAKSIALLVRARSQLVDLITLLKSYDIPFYAKEIKQLSRMPHVLDLLSLVKAVNHWGDRIAWLSVLRAPWVGLSLSDIYIITEASSQESYLWETIKTYESILGLSQQAKDRLKPFVLVLDYWNYHRDRKSTALWIKGLWLRLGGERCYPNPVKNDLDQIFKMLETFTDPSGNIDFYAFEEKLLSVYTDQMNSSEKGTSGNGSCQLQLMTIHQAKGLEFDYVMLPNIEQVTQRNDSPLLNWHESWYGENKLFLMGAKTTQKTNKNSIYYYLNKVIQQKQSYELIRLLYVAMTRAKSKLYLCFSLEKNEQNEFIKPRQGSFLSLLWQHIEFREGNPENSSLKSTPEPEVLLNNKITTEYCHQIPFVYRAANPIVIHQREHDFSTEKFNQDDLNRPELTDNHFKIAGTIFHRLIAYYCQMMKDRTLNVYPQQMVFREGTSFENSSVKGITAQELIKRIPFLLGRYGFSQDCFMSTQALIRKAIENIFQDTKGQWILNINHKHRLYEKGFTHLKQGITPKRIIIDCGFVDEKNQMWVVDFKLTQSTNLDQIELKTEIEDYKKQLYCYKQVMEHQMERSVKTALYFPSIPYWYEV